MNILLVCACGSSTSILMQNMRDNLAPEEKDWTVEALSVSDAKTKFGKYDYVLLAPQVKYQGGMIRDICKDLSTTVLDIPSIDFGRCNGKSVLDMIRKSEENKK